MQNNRTMTTYVDRAFAQKLERVEARASADFVDTRLRLEPECGAAWIEVGGAYAMYDGAESPLTQTFGLGMFVLATAEHLDEIEAFYAERDSPVMHEVCPLADLSILGLLSGRGYRPVEVANMMYRELDAASVVTRKRDPLLTTRIIDADEVDMWARTSAAAWATEHESLGKFMLDYSRISARCDGAFPFIAELDGRPVATGMLFIHGDVCLLAGAATVADARNRGAQTALLEARLTHAAATGCTLATMAALPGSQSQINAQKHTFKTAYTRTKWQLVR